jgi:hypothetical protein
MHFAPDLQIGALARGFLTETLQRSTADAAALV